VHVAYGGAFARIYNLEWTGFANRVAPYILDHYESILPSEASREVLDLGCGTGQLAHYFLERGYRVTGLDLSADMLRYARENNQNFIDSGQATFMHGNAAEFSLDHAVGLVACTFDMLNHLEDMSALARCFRSVAAVLARDGVFIFDLNTRTGLRRWNSIQVQDTEQAMIVNRGIYDEQSDRAYVRISGFVRTPEGQYERFEETAFNTVFELDAVREQLRDAGFERAHFARVEDLATPIENPEEESRVFVVARR
jgi:SAM-dependent methyltransferase